MIALFWHLPPSPTVSPLLVTVVAFHRCHVYHPTFPTRLPPVAAVSKTRHFPTAVGRFNRMNLIMMRGYAFLRTLPACAALPVPALPPLGCFGYRLGLLP